MISRRDFLRKLGIVSVGTVTGIPALGDVEKVIGAAGDYAPTPTPDECSLKSDMWFRVKFDAESEAMRFFTSDDGEDWTEQSDSPLALEVDDYDEDIDAQCCVNVEDWDNIGEDINLMEKYENSLRQDPKAKRLYRFYLTGDGGFSSEAIVHEAKEFDADGNLTFHFEAKEPDPTEVEVTWMEL